MTRKNQLMALSIGTVSTALAALVACWFATPAEAVQLRATIVITQAEVPKKLTEKGLISFVKGHRTTRLQETPGGDVKDRKWKANMLVTFNTSPGDLEYEVIFYDIDDGARRLVQEMSTFVNDRSQKTYLQKIVLERPRFRPNRNMEVVVSVRRSEVGSMKFGVMGEEPRRSGKVEFTDEETKEETKEGSKAGPVTGPAKTGPKAGAK
jgi:hypothetical protein